jgi:hypothetical protein
LVARHDKALLRKVNIGSWKSKAAEQARDEFDLEALPTVVVFDGDGEETGRVVGGNVAEIEELVRQALGE